MRLWIVSFSFQSSAIFSPFSLLELKSQWSCGWKMENCKKCSPGIRCVGCSDGNHVSHHERSVGLREVEINTVCSEFVKVEVIECHPLRQCETGTAADQNIVYLQSRSYAGKEQASLLSRFPHDCPVSSGKKVWKIGNLPPCWLSCLAVSDSKEDHCRWCFGDLTQKQPELGQSREEEACSTCGSKLRAICSSLLASKAFFPTHGAYFLCAFTFILRGFHFFSSDSSSVLPEQVWRCCFSGILGVEMTIMA